MLLYLIYLLLICILILVCSVCKMKKKLNLCYNVFWASSPDNWTYRRHGSLSNYINKAQINIPDQTLCIQTKEEWEFAEALLGKYQEYIGKLFSFGHLNKCKPASLLSGEKFFFISFKWYLQEHRFDLYIDDYKLYCQEEIKYWPGDIDYDFVYSLTSFGRLYHKLLLIVDTYLLRIERVEAEDIDATVNVLKANQLSGYAYH